MTHDKTVNVDSSNFEDEVLKSDVPVVVDFWAAWCGPCRMVAPLLEEVAEDMNGKIKIAKLDVDQNQEIAIKYQVQSIPTFILFKDGQVADRMMGAMPKNQIENFVNRNL